MCCYGQGSPCWCSSGECSCGLTFFELSWDVMEPISYFFSSLWGIVGIRLLHGKPPRARILIKHICCPFSREQSCANGNVLSAYSCTNPLCKC